MAFTPQRWAAGQWGISTKKEGTYGTALVDASLTKRPVLTAADFGAIAMGYRSDLGKSMLGHEHMTEREIVSQSVSRAMQCELSSWMAAWVAAFGMGAVSTAGATAPYTHTITFMTGAGQVPSTTIWEKSSDGLGMKLKGMCCKDFTIASQKTGIPTLTSNWLGSGEVSIADLASIPSVSSTNYLLAKDQDIKLGAPGSMASIKERGISWQVQVSLNPAEGDARYPGSGLYGGRMWRGVRRASVQLVVWAKDTSDDILTLLLNNTAQSVQFECPGATAANDKLTILVPYLKFEKTERSAQDDWMIWTLTAGDEGLYVSGGSELITFTVINSEAAFLDAEA